MAGRFTAFGGALGAKGALGHLCGFCGQTAPIVVREDEMHPRYEARAPRDGPMLPACHDCHAEQCAKLIRGHIPPTPARFCVIRMDGGVCGKPVEAGAVGDLCDEHNLWRRPLTREEMHEYVRENAF